MTPLMHYLLILLSTHYDRARRSERGASAVEWVIITLVLIGIAVAVGAIIRAAVVGRAGEINLGP